MVDFRKRALNFFFQFVDYRVSQRGHPHSRTPSLDLRHTRNSSADLNKLFKNEIGLVFGPQQGILIKKINK